MSLPNTAYMPRGLAQQRMTLSDLEWPFYGLSVKSTLGYKLSYHTDSVRCVLTLLKLKD